jgi:hypothetical protein
VWTTVNTPAILKITPDTTAYALAFSFSKTSGSVVDVYTGVCTSVPATFAKNVRDLDVSKNFTFEVSTKNGTTSYIQSITRNAPLCFYVKSAKPWDHHILWTAYDRTGHIATTFDQIIVPDSLSASAADVPLLFAAQYSSKFQYGPLGGYFGFVDKRMSLLALEKDTLGSVLSALYRNSGVPVLLPNEIIITSDTSGRNTDPTVVYVKPPSTLVKNDIAALSSRLQVSIMPNGLITISLGTNNTSMVSVELYDLSGRLVFSQKNLSASVGKISLTIPKNIKGLYVLKVFAGKESSVQRINVR